jgi:CubicO group peptidase (beta-lactamase class C family)
MEHLLRMSSGLEWQETYEYAPLHSNVVKMLYTVGRADMGLYVWERPQEASPGSRFRYSSGDSNLLSRVLRARVGERDWPRWPFKELFEPLGMARAIVERDPSGTLVGSSYWFDTPRDFARFGLLYLRGGRVGDRQLLPADWVSFVTTLAPSFATTDAKEAGDESAGAHFWLNVPPRPGAKRPWPRAPEDAYAAEGHWGQYIFVVPSRDAVLVRTGDDRDHAFEPDEFLHRALALLP